MGNPTTHFLAFCGWVVLVLMLQCLYMGSATRLERQNYHTVSAQYFKWKEPQGAVECPGSPAGEEALKPGVNIRLDHIHGACSPLKPTNSRPWIPLVSQIFEGDNARLNTIMGRSKNRRPYSPQSDVPIVPGKILGLAEYVVIVGIGTPTTRQLLIMNTASDVSWIQCNPCSDCYSQVDPIFNPNASSSYKRINCTSEACINLGKYEPDPFECVDNNFCEYDELYADLSRSQGDYSHETLTLGSDSFEGFAFGCGHTNKGNFNGTSGFLGLGRRPIAFPNQTRSKFGGIFSYCLPDFLSSNSTGSLSFGESSIPATAAFTPLLTVPHDDPRLYFVGLNGISVGGERLSISSATLAGKGTVVDSGTTITKLSIAAYDAVKTSLRNKTQNLPSAEPHLFLDTCYNLSGYSDVNLPTITFHFANNSDMTVSHKGMLYPVKDDGSQTCLAFTATEPVDDYTIIGNFQQQGTRMVFDNKGGRIGFASGSCYT
eukprot:PITA_28106